MYLIGLEYGCQKVQLRKNENYCQQSIKRQVGLNAPPAFMQNRYRQA